MTLPLFHRTDKLFANTHRTFENRPTVQDTRGGILIYGKHTDDSLTRSLHEGIMTNTENPWMTFCDVFLCGASMTYRVSERGILKCSLGGGSTIYDMFTGHFLS